MATVKTFFLALPFETLANAPCDCCIVVQGLFNLFQLFLGEIGK